MAIDPFTIARLGLGGVQLARGLSSMRDRQEDQRGQERIRRLLQQAQATNLRQGQAIAGSGAGISPALAQRAALQSVSEANQAATASAMDQEAALALADRERTDRLVGAELGALGAFGGQLITAMQDQGETDADADAAERARKLEEAMKMAGTQQGLAQAAPQAATQEPPKPAPTTPGNATAVAAEVARRNEIPVVETTTGDQSQASAASTVAAQEAAAADEGSLLERFLAYDPRNPDSSSLTPEEFEHIEKSYNRAAPALEEMSIEGLGLGESPSPGGDAGSTAEALAALPANEFARDQVTEVANAGTLTPALTEEDIARIGARQEREGQALRELDPFIDSKLEADALSGYTNDGAALPNTSGRVNGGMRPPTPVRGPEDLTRQLAEQTSVGTGSENGAFAPAFQGRLPRANRAALPYDPAHRSDVSAYGLSRNLEKENYDPSRFSFEAERAYARTREDRAADAVYNNLIRTASLSGSEPIVSRSLLRESPELATFLTDENIATLGRGGPEGQGAHATLVNILIRGVGGMNARQEAQRILTAAIAQRARMFESFPGEGEGMP